MDLLHFSMFMNKFSIAIIFTSLNFFSCLYILFHLISLPVKFMQISLLPAVSGGAVGTCSWFAACGWIQVLGSDRAGLPCPNDSPDLPLPPAASYPPLQGLRINFFGEEAGVWMKMCRLCSLVNSCGTHSCYLVPEGNMNHDVVHAQG